MEKKRKFREIKENLERIGLNRTYAFWSVEEDEALLNYYHVDKSSKIEIAKILGRTLGSINSRLKLHDSVFDSDNIAQNNFIEYIQHGYNPITGEELSEDSVWRHPKILEDIVTYKKPLKVIKTVTEQNNFEEKEISKESNINYLNQEEFKTFSDLINNTKNLLPNLSNRDYELMRSLYSKSKNGKKTLQKVAEEFNISRERVRQIRNKTLKKISRKLNSSNTLNKDLKSNNLQEFHETNQDEETINAKLKNQEVPWLGEDEKKLLEMYNDKKPYDEIATIFQRNVKSIKDKLNQLYLAKNSYFKLEENASITPISLKHKFIDKKIINDKDKLQSLRDSNLNKKRLLNSGFPVIKEEVDLILRMNESGSDIRDMEQYFQRSEVSILHIIEKYSAPE